MAGNRPDSTRSNASPQPDRGPPGAPRRSDPASGYAEPKPSRSATRDAPDPTTAGSQSAQAGTPPAQDPDHPDINEPVPPGDVPSKTPVKEPEKGEAPPAVFADAARPVVPGPADGAD